MSLHDAGVLAGSVSTVLFVASYLPMLIKAARTRDLASYSLGSFAVTNLGNLVHTVYVVSLPVGPIWALHGFYLVSTVLMTWWYLRYRRRPEHHESVGGRLTERRAAGVSLSIHGETGTHDSGAAGERRDHCGGALSR
nr:hypothetical protein [Propionicimonas sp.]